MFRPIEGCWHVEKACRSHRERRGVPVSAARNALASKKRQQQRRPRHPISTTTRCCAQSGRSPSKIRDLLQFDVPRPRRGNKATQPIASEEVIRPGNSIGDNRVAIHRMTMEIRHVRSPSHGSALHGPSAFRLERPRCAAPPDLGSQSSASTMLGWAAAIFAVIVVLALVIGYNRNDTVSSTNPNEPTTTGAAIETPPTPAPQPVA
jgi:hypothetical protein